MNDFDFWTPVCMLGWYFWWPFLTPLTNRVHNVPLYYGNLSKIKGVPHKSKMSVRHIPFQRSTHTPCLSGLKAHFGHSHYILCHHISQPYVTNNSLWKVRGDFFPDSILEAYCLSKNINSMVFPAVTKLPILISRLAFCLQRLQQKRVFSRPGVNQRWIAP